MSDFEPSCRWNYSSVEGSISLLGNESSLLGMEEMSIFGMEAISLLGMKDNSLFAVKDKTLGCRITEESTVNIKETNVE